MSFDVEGWSAKYKEGCYHVHQYHAVYIVNFFKQVNLQL